MASYDYGSPSPSPSPPPADGHIHHLPKDASFSDVILLLRRRANDGPADGHRQQQQQQQQMHVITMDSQIPPVRKPDGTTTRYMIITNTPNRPEAATATSPRRRRHHHHHRANTVATPYHCPERWSNHRRRPSLAPHENDYKGATKVVCLTKMLRPGDRLEDDGFYREFLEDVTKEARKFGDLVKVVIPRPGPGIGGGGGVGKVFLEYTHLDDAAWCRKRLDGRFYGGKEITAVFFPRDRFAAGDYDYDG